ncbi:MAG: response regulator [Candidatus Thermoplasmatota archaeon]|nr:response regulator [Candidatus Thermoplasmatota archaeon]
MNEIVLIVDDESMIHELLGINLQKMKTPVEIHNALTGEEAIEIYKTLLDKGKRPDLVVMDLNLSGKDNITNIETHMKGVGKMDGVRTTEEILKIDPKARIWGYTAWFDTEWSKNFEKYADKIVERTIPFHKFSEMVDKFFQ